MEEPQPDEPRNLDEDREQSSDVQREVSRSVSLSDVDEDPLGQDDLPEQDAAPETPSPSVPVNNPITKVIGATLITRRRQPVNGKKEDAPTDAQDKGDAGQAYDDGIPTLLKILALFGIAAMFVTVFVAARM